MNDWWSFSEKRKKCTICRMVVDGLGRLGKGTRDNEGQGGSRISGHAKLNLSVRTL